MANEITFGYITGRTLKYGVYNPDGTEVTAPTTALSEIGSTGYYTATNGDIAAADLVIVHDTTGGGDFVCGFGEYKPEVSVSDVDGKIDIIDANIDTLIVDRQTVNSVKPVPEPKETRARIYI